MSTLRVRVFVDFWNLQLTLNGLVGADYRLDWKALSPRLVAEAETILEEPLHLEGTHVYVSLNPRTKKGKRLRGWAMSFLDRCPGIRVICKERKPKGLPRCPTCHEEVKVCPVCGAAMQGTVEKGIDTAIVTDMISLAWENAWDVAILASSDHDLIPPVEFLTTKGRKIINAHFPPVGAHLARTCWAPIDMRRLLKDLERPSTAVK